MSEQDSEIPLNQKFHQLAGRLDAMAQREKQLSQLMRQFADTTDALSDDLSEIQHLCQDLSQVEFTPSASQVGQEVQQEALSPNLPLKNDVPLSVEQPFQKAVSVETSTEYAEQPDIEHPDKQESEHEPEETHPSPHINRDPMALYLKDVKESPSSNLKGTSRFELDLGTKWFSRMGIVALLVGIAMALAYTFPSFSNELKLFIGILTAFGLFFGGTKLHNGFPVLGRILQGGGIATGYLSLFAAFFIPDVQLFQSQVAGLSVLFVYVGFSLWLSHKLSSEAVSVLSLVFGYFTAVYAESAGTAFATTAILSLATVGTARLHPTWQLLPKVNLIGALWTYSHWYRQADDDSISKLYLIYTYCLFHIVSLFRANQGDVLLNLMNTLGFYVFYKSTQPEIMPNGALEFALMAIQFLSLLLLHRLFPQPANKDVHYSLLIIGLLFSGLGIFNYFDSENLPVLFSSYAFGLGFLAAKTSYRKILTVAAYTALILAYITLFFGQFLLSDFSLCTSITWITLVTIALECFPLRKHFKGIRIFLLGVSLFMLLCIFGAKLPEQWRTISFIGTGFGLMAVGFILNRI
ncbi:MAG: DUF2339 domain-containing protein [Vampirovibrio sp.]|nr:DUF2339 domain-containing protein [Vampirovibrio sp.]